MAPAAYGQGGPPKTTGPPCPPGSEFEVTNGIGRCVSDQPPQPCPPPSEVNPETGLCEAPAIDRCPSDAPYNSQTGKCGEGLEPLQCQPPYEVSSDGKQCIRSTEPRQCQPPYEVSTDGKQCVFPSNNPCPEGSKIDTSTNQCIYNANRCPQGFNPETSTTGIQQCRQQNR